MSLTGPTGTYALAYEIVQAGPTGVTLSGTGMSYLDTRNSSGIFILPDESIASLKKVALYQRRSSNAFVQTSRGSLLLTPSNSIDTLHFVDTSWRIIDNPLADSFYPSTLDAQINSSVVNVSQQVSLSSDGNTIAIGIPGSASIASHVSVYYRTGPGTWTQDPFSFIGSGTGTAQNQEGFSVNLNSDGTTLAVGGPQDGGGVGAVWIYTQVLGTWSQQAKLIGTGNIGNALQGSSVDLSDDGNTLVIGGPGDNSDNGAVWIFTRSEGSWTQQIELSIGLGNLFGSTFFNPALVGTSVAVNSQGTTVVIGGPQDSSITTNIGAIWIVSLSMGSWTEQTYISGASVLNSTGSIGFSSGALFGQTVAIDSADNFIAVGVPGDSEISSGLGCVWTTTQAFNQWDPNGEVVIGSGATGSSQQGTAIDISADSNTIVFSGATDGTSGAVWVMVNDDQAWIQTSKIPSVGPTGFGSSLSLSSNANTMACGSIGETDIFI